VAFDRYNQAVTLELPERIVSRMSQISYQVGLGDSPVPEIERLINSSLLVGGKRIRPLLVMLVSDWVSTDKKASLVLARSVELVHAASLAHDDVLDESDMRRNKPTLRRLSSNSRAVLSGDLLLSLTLREIAELGNLKLVQSLAHSSEMLVYGEWLQQELIGKIDIQEEQLLAVHQKKTSSLMSWACHSPFLVPSNPLKISDTNRFDGLLKELGSLVGAAFQIVDDVVDYSKDSEKPFALDLTEGLINTVSLRMIRNNPSLRRAFQEIIIKRERPEKWPWTPDELNQAIAEMRSMASARIFAASRVLDEAHEILPMAPDIRHTFDSLFEMLGERKK